MVDPPPLRSAGRARRALGGVAFALAAAAVLGVPLATASPAPGVTLRAPFKQVTVGVLTLEESSACGIAHVAYRSKWSAKLGVATGAGNSRAPPCASGASPNSAAWEMDALMSYAFRFHSTGSHTVTITVTADYLASWRDTPYGSCALDYAATESECNVTSAVLVEFAASLYDQNGSIYETRINATLGQVYTQNESVNPCAPTSFCGTGYNRTSGSAGSFSGSTTYVLSFRLAGASAVGSTSANYTLDLSALAGTTTVADAHHATASGKASADAAISLARLGQGLFLDRIVIA